VEEVEEVEEGKKLEGSPLTATAEDVVLLPHSLLLHRGSSSSAQICPVKLWIYSDDGQLHLPILPSRHVGKRVVLSWRCTCLTAQFVTQSRV
jgi:hypothetical protein